jgi:hypothetical protein
MTLSLTRIFETGPGEEKGLGRKVEKDPEKRQRNQDERDPVHPSVI